MDSISYEIFQTLVKSDKWKFTIQYQKTFDRKKYPDNKFSLLNNLPDDLKKLKIMIMIMMIIMWMV